MAALDHDARRTRVAEIACDLVADEGLEALTIRNVAAAGGFSTKAITHYFASKNELLLWTYVVAARRSQKRVDKVLARDRADLQGLLEALLPMEESSSRDWRVYIAFWQSATIDKIYAAEQRWWQRNASNLIREVIYAQYGPRPSLDEEARILLALIQGIAVQAAFDDPDWAPARQRDLLRHQLAVLFHPPEPRNSPV